jgi:hypothetical protein
MNRVRLALASVSLAVGAFIFSPGTEAQSNVWFRADFQTPGTDNRYNFEYRWPAPTMYHVTHLPNGGDQGTGDGAVNVRQHAGQSQYNLGWIISALNRSFSVGDSVFIRFRIRYDDDYSGWVDRQGKNKFFLIGSTGTTPNSRVIVYMHPPNDSFGCTLGQQDHLNGTGAFPWATTQYFGLTGSWFTSPLAGNYGSIGPYVNINWIGNCAPPALVTRATTANAPAPGPNSARPVNGWYHFQIQATSGPAGGGAFRMWVNNNTYSAPTSIEVGLRDGLGVTGWGNSQIYIGGYQDNPPNAEIGYRLDDVEVGGSFDSTWATGGGAGTPPPPPPSLSAPTGVRIISSN